MPQDEQAYAADMTAYDLSRFIRGKFPAARADSILARMESGASYGDALYSTGKDRAP